MTFYDVVLLLFCQSNQRSNGNRTFMASQSRVMSSAPPSPHLFTIRLNAQLLLIAVVW